MRKCGYKRVHGKNKDIQDRVRHEGIYCISSRWMKWAKKYLSRTNRRTNNERRKTD